jgi:hypothetical protein
VLGLSSNRDARQLQQNDSPLNSNSLASATPRTWFHPDLNPPSALISKRLWSMRIVGDTPSTSRSATTAGGCVTELRNVNPVSRVRPPVVVVHLISGMLSSPCVIMVSPIPAPFSVSRLLNVRVEVHVQDPGLMTRTSPGLAAATAAATVA